MLTATLERRLPLPKGVRVVGATAFEDGRVMALARGGGVWFSWVEEGGLGPAIKRGEALGGDVCAFAAGRLFLGLDGDVELFDGRTGRSLGRFEPHAGETYGLMALPGARLLTEGADGRRRLWSADSLTLLGDVPTRWSRGVSSPEGLRPGDPVLTTRSSVRRGVWTTALLSLDTGRELGRVSTPFEGRPAHHTSAPCLGALEWVGVITPRVGRAWGLSRVFHLNAGRARLIDEAPPPGELPGVVRLRCLNTDWLYTEGWRDPVMINLKTGERRACPRDGLVSAAGLMLCRDERAVLQLRTGRMAALYPGPEPEPGRRVLTFAADGESAWVSTETALEQWRLEGGDSA